MRRAIDTIKPVETPDGIELPLNPAGPIPRAVAWLIDLMIRAGIMIVLSFMLAFLEYVGIALILIAWFLINWWYPVFFEVFSHGATPGKKAMGLKVLLQDGTPVNWGASIIRNLVRQIDFLPLFYFTGLISMFCNQRFQRLGDLAAGTLVVHVDRQQAALQTLPDGPSEPLPITLNADEQRTLLAFAERSKRLNPDRAAELANILTPLTGQSGLDGLQRVMSWARALQGGKA